MAPQNRAAILTGAKVRPLKVESVPYTAPGPNQLVVRNRAVAVNPVDLGKQAAGDNMFGWIKYPFVLGSDVAGEVVEVGAGDAVRALFKPGDRVLGHALGMDKRSNASAEGAFQEYTVLRAGSASPIPADMAFERACVLPLCLSTAACGLFLKNYLGLRLPTSPGGDQGPREVVVVWGGSTAVGSNAIQLATAAGYDVLTTASPRNFDYVRGLGAVDAFDYHDAAAAVAGITAALRDRVCAGALAVGNGSLEACIDVVAAAAPGGSRKFVAQASIPLDPGTMPQGALALVGVMAGYLKWQASVFLRAKLRGVQTKFIWGSDVIGDEVLSKAIYTDFLPEALRTGRYQAKPDPHVVGNGLEHVQEALDNMAKERSVTKFVVTL